MKLLPHKTILIPLCVIYILPLFGSWEANHFQPCTNCWPSPVGQKEGADVGHGWSGRPELGQRHDVLEGDVRLRADVRHAHVLRRGVVAVLCDGRRASGGGSPQNLDDDGLPPDGLHHRLLMVNFGEVACVHLLGQDSESLGQPVSLHFITDSFLYYIFRQVVIIIRGNKRSKEEAAESDEMIQ